jgi:hypothetical protein
LAAPLHFHAAHAAFFTSFFCSFFGHHFRPPFWLTTDDASKPGYHDPGVFDMVEA